MIALGGVRLQREVEDRKKRSYATAMNGKKGTKSLLRLEQAEGNEPKDSNQRKRRSSSTDRPSSARARKRELCTSRARRKGGEFFFSANRVCKRSALKGKKRASLQLLRVRRATIPTESRERKGKKSRSKPSPYPRGPESKTLRGLFKKNRSWFCFSAKENESPTGEGGKVTSIPFSVLGTGKLSRGRKKPPAFLFSDVKLYPIPGKRLSECSLSPQQPKGRGGRLLSSGGKKRGARDLTYRRRRERRRASGAR